MLQLKRNSLSVALACALLAVASGAQAQSDAPSTATPDPVAADDKAKAAAKAKAEAEANGASEMEVISVVGIRRGIESAIALKQDSTSIIEAISSEDIGKLPDSSIAESIARLPGLSAQRVAGRSSTISIRGLAGDFSTTLLNGREQVSSGDNRGVEFDQYPSELLSSVVVYKTPDATLVAQGISGTVDLRTVRPLAFPDRVIAVSARGEQNSLGELNPGYSDLGSRFSLSYIDQFADNTVGVAVGYARLDSPGQADRWNAWGYPTDIQPVPGVRAIGGTESFASSTDNVRDGLMAVVEFRPSDFYSGTLDVYYSKFERAETTRGLQSGLGWSGATLSNPVVENGILVGGRFTGVRPVLRNDLNTREDDIFAIGFNNEFQFSDDWRGVADFSLSRANRDERILETYSGAAGTDVVNFTLNPSTGLPDLNFGLDYANPAVISLTDPGGWGQDGYVKYPKFKDELRSIKLSAERSFQSGFISSLEFGVNHSKREKSRDVAEAFLDLIGGDRVAIPGALLNGPADLSFTGIPGVISYDINGAFGTLYSTRTHLHPDILNKDWRVEETVINAFIKLNIDTEIGSLPLRGNIGLQNVNADQTSQGFATPDSTATRALPFSGGTDYSDLLPSLNLALSLPYDQKLRFGAAKSVARPRMDQMRANNGFSIDRTVAAAPIWSGGGGNPELEPWRATGYDLSYEKYFDNKGYVSAAVFHKDLENYIYDRTDNFDFSVFNLTGFTGTQPVSTIGRFSRPVNGDGGTMNGWEVAVSVPLDMVWSVLDGFGVLANYSNTRSSIQPDGPDRPSQTLPGLSPHVTNVTFYYEKYGFSARISQRSRSKFRGEVQGFGADRDTRYVGGEKIVDFQTGYEFGEGSLKGLSLLLQVNNLNNEPYQELFYDNNGNYAPRSYNEYGRTTLLGASFKF